MENGSVDTVALTYTPCRIPDWHRAREQMRRVLKPGGQLLFWEHGAAADEDMRWWQDCVNSLWRKVAGVGNRNRSLPELLDHAGFGIERMETSYLPKAPRLVGFNFRGAATSR